MWVALKPFRYRGVLYNPGDSVPAESWINKKAFVSTRKMKLVPDEIPEPPPVFPERLKRADLDEYARTLGLNPEEYANRKLLLEAVEATLHPASDDDSTDDTSTDEKKDEKPLDSEDGDLLFDVEDEADVVVTNPVPDIEDDEDPFKDLDDDDKGT